MECILLEICQLSGEFLDFLLYCGREDILYVFLSALMTFCHMLSRSSFIPYVGDLGLHSMLCTEYCIFRKDLFRDDKILLITQNLN